MTKVSAPWGNPLARLGCAKTPLSGLLVATLAKRRGGEEPGSPTREIALRIVAGEPGIPLTRLRARLGVSWGTLFYHLQILVARGRIRILRQGRRRLAFTSQPVVSEASIVAAGVLEGRTALRIARAIRAHPDARIHELAAATGETQRVVYYHVRRFLQAGVVTRSSPTRHFGLQLAPGVAELLGRFGGER